MTTRSSSHARIARAATILAALLLLFLFVFPIRQVARMKRTIMPLADATTQAVIDTDWDAARTLCAQMRAAYAPYDGPLRLYFNHEDVDQLQTRILACYNLARAEDDQIIVDLEDTKNTLRYLEGIETFSLYNLF